MKGENFVSHKKILHYISRQWTTEDSMREFKNDIYDKWQMAKIVSDFDLFFTTRIIKISLLFRANTK